MPVQQRSPWGCCVSGPGRSERWGPGGLGPGTPAPGGGCLVERGSRCCSQGVWHRLGPHPLVQQDPRVRVLPTREGHGAWRRGQDPPAARGINPCGRQERRTEKPGGEEHGRRRGKGPRGAVLAPLGEVSQHSGSCRERLGPGRAAPPEEEGREGAGTRPGCLCAGHRLPGWFVWHWVLRPARASPCPAVPHSIARLPLGLRRGHIPDKSFGLAWGGPPPREGTGTSVQARSWEPFTGRRSEVVFHCCLVTKGQE